MIQDLCIIMLTAGITSLVFKAFKQPVVLGYIVAGMLVGPHVLGGLWVTNEENVETWGEIGVLFLLFSLGLEFSFKKLLKVGSTAVIGAGVIVVGMMIAGMLTAHFLGLGGMNALFLGGMLFMSSTTIVFKAIEEAGLRSHRFAGVCFGILIVEDLFAVVLMVLLTSIAVKNEFEGKELLWQVGKLVMYIAIWFIMGILLIPTFLKKFKKHLNDETLTIFSIADFVLAWCCWLCRQDSAARWVLSSWARCWQRPLMQNASSISCNLSRTSSALSSSCLSA